MIWDRIVGQSEPIAILRRSAATQRLAHGWLFSGPAGVGKRLVAETFATALLCDRIPETELDACGECPSCRMMSAGTHPDFLTVARPEGKSELPIELLVGSLENRGREGLCYDLSLRPMTAGRRVAVIDDADRMSTESANALLKTLEEPPSYAVIILVASDSAALLPTIRSRCQILRFGPLGTADVARLVRAQGWAESDTEAAEAASLAGGSLATAQQLLDAELRAVRLELLKNLVSNRFQASATARTALAGLDRIGGETMKQRTNALWIVRFIIDCLHGALRLCAETAEGSDPSSAEALRPDSAALLARLPDDFVLAAELIGEAIDRCVLAEEQLHSNVSIPLCLESLFADLATLLQPASSPS